MRREGWVICLSLLLLLGGLAEGAEQIRGALVVDDEGDLQASPLVSLLETQLSQDDRLQLLERDRIDAVLREQRIGLAGAAEPNVAVQVGRLLRADVLVLLDAAAPPAPVRATAGATEREEGVGSLLRVRVVETAHGLRLCDSFEPLDQADVRETAARIADRVLAVIGKIGWPPGQVVPLGIIDIHRVQLPDEFERLARVMRALLSARLNKEPRLLVLERESLGGLLREKQLAEGEDAGFWSSAVLIDGYVQPDPNAGIRMKLRLRRSGGQELDTLATPVDPDAPAIAIDQATAEIVRVLLDATPSGSWDPATEAEEFYHQGVMLRGHRRCEEAVAPLETAHALQPEDLSYTAGVFDNEWGIRGYELGRAFEPTGRSGCSDLELAELASVLVRQIQRDYERNETFSSRYLYDRWGRVLGVQLDAGSYFGSKASASSDTVRQINRTNRRMWVQVMDRALRERYPQRGYPFVSTCATLPWLGYDDPDELLVALRTAFARLFFPPAEGGKVASSSMRCWLAGRVFLSVHEHRVPERYKGTHLEEAAEQVAALWGEYLDTLPACRDPIVRFYGLTAQALRLGRAHDPEAVRRARDTYLKALDVLLGELLNSAELVLDSFKPSLCDYYLSVVQTVVQGNGSEMIQVLERVYVPLIRAGDANALAWWSAARAPSDLLVSQPDWAERYSRMLNAASSALESHVGNREVDRALRLIRRYQDAIHARYPQTASKPAPSAIRVHMLVPKADGMVQMLDGPRQMPCEIRGNMLFATAAGRDAKGQEYVMVVRADLTRERPPAVWQVKVPSVVGVFPSMAVGPHASYVSISGLGVLVFPDASAPGPVRPSEGTILTQREGLPSVSITGMTAEGKRLWIAYRQEGQEAGLGLYDPGAHRWQTVLCSTMEGEPPFFANRPYRLTRLVCPSPGRLLFVMMRSPSPEMQRWLGLWTMDTKTHELEHLGECGTNDSPFGYFDATGGDICWCKNVSSLVKLDLKTGVAFHVLGAYAGSTTKPPSRYTPWLHWQDDHFLPPGSLRTVSFSPFYNGGLDLSTGAVHGDELWARLGESQVVVLKRGRPFEEATIIPNDILDGEQAVRFVSTPYGLVAIGNGTVGLVETSDAPVRTQE